VQRRLLAHPDRVAARLRGAHHGDSRVLVRLERVGRIDDEEEIGQAAFSTCSARP
jgi:hypothetical protein